MKSFFSLTPVLAAVAALGCIAAYAQADEFKFSYTFSDGSIWSGTFDGTASGNLVTGISDVTLDRNGVSVGPSIYAGNYDAGYQAGGDRVLFQWFE